MKKNVSSHGKSALGMGHRPVLCSTVPVNLGIEIMFPEEQKQQSSISVDVWHLICLICKNLGFFSNTSMTQALNERQKVWEMLAGRPAAA